MDVPATGGQILPDLGRAVCGRSVRGWPPNRVGFHAGTDLTDDPLAWILAGVVRGAGAGVHQDGAGLHPDDDVDTPAGFSSWVERLLREADTSIPAREGRVHGTYWWVAQGGTYLGAISLRHELNDFLLRAGGHIGYGIRPSARGRGVATWALRSTLPRGIRTGSGESKSTGYLR